MFMLVRMLSREKTYSLLVGVHTCSFYANQCSVVVLQDLPQASSMSLQGMDIQDSTFYHRNLCSFPDALSIQNS